jgi:hypothetical protein
MNPNSVVPQGALYRTVVDAVDPTRGGADLRQQGRRRIDDGRRKLRFFLFQLLTYAIVMVGVTHAWAAPPKAGGGSNATTPGDPTSPYPTITNLSVEWPISGDANNNSVVTVQYRVANQNPPAPWIDGMPLQRVPAGSSGKLSWTNKHSGSIFDLEPNTTYEIQLTLIDPDNSAPIVKTVTPSPTTRADPSKDPRLGAPGTTVTPATFASYAANSSTTILDLSAGTYAGFTFNRDGSASQPIIIRSTAGAVINGNITLDKRKFVYLDGLTINGKISYDGSDHVAVMHCEVHTTDDGIESWTRSQYSYIADNMVFGATQWAASSLGVHGNNVGEGILFNGPGHVIRNNFVHGFRDNISTAEQANETFSDDVLNNDISDAGDDGAEIDYCFHNCRVLRNRITNTFMGLSSQPSLGGPTYFIRNVMYNVIYEAFKLHNDTTGVVVLHNTVVKSGDAFMVNDNSSINRSLFRNNLFIGGPGGTWNGYVTNVGSDGIPRVASVQNWTLTADADYDAYGSVDGRFQGKFATTFFFSLDEMHTKTREHNAVQLLSANTCPDPKNGVCSQITGIFLNPIDYPYYPFPERAAPALSLSYDPNNSNNNSAAIDVGAVILNINTYSDDDFTLNAPDAGAYEVGVLPPEYGPRPRQ